MNAWQLKQAPSLKTLFEFGHLAEDVELVLLNGLKVGETVGSGRGSRSRDWSRGRSRSSSGGGGNGGVVAVDGLTSTDIE